MSGAEKLMAKKKRRLKQDAATGRVVISGPLRTLLCVLDVFRAHRTRLSTGRIGSNDIFAFCATCEISLMC